MTIVKRRNLKFANSEILDDGILVKDAIKLIKDSDYYNHVIEAFDVEAFMNDFIEIKGAQGLVETLIEADEEYDKIDVDSPLGNVRLDKYTEDKQIILEISDIKDKSILTKTKADMLRAESLYSVRSEYLNMFGIDKYLEFCQANDYQDIIDINIGMLNEKTLNNNKCKKFRLLKDKENKYYMRGITSTNIYRDYNLRFSLFITLIELHKLSKYKDLSFYVHSYSLTESDLQVIFKTTKTSQVSKDTKIGFALELVNDEIKRDAVKFNGIFTVFMGEQEVYIKPVETKSNILSFSHSIGIEKLQERLSTLYIVINDFVNDTIEDAKKIRVLTAPDLFREHLLMKVQFSKNAEFNKLYKDRIQSMLSNKVNTIFELATILGKIELLIEDEHISSLDFWRYKLYQVLMDEVKIK